jgi:hypothetical protein
MANTLAVKITADIVELQTKFSIAKAETNALQAELNRLSRASAAGVIDETGKARLSEVAGLMLTARQNAQSLGGQLEQAGVSASSFGRSMEHGHGAISTATREFRALFDELSSGRFHQAPGTVAILLQRVAGLGLAAMGAVGGVIALAGGLAYLAYKAASVSNALDDIHLGAQFTGNLDLARGRIKQFADQMATSANISKDQSLELASAIARIPGMTDPAFQALSTMMGDMIAQSGVGADKIAEHVKKMFGPETSAAKFASEIAGVTQAQKDAAETADKTGNANAVLAEKLTLQAAALKTGTAEQDAHAASMTRSFSNLMEYFALTIAQTAATEAGIAGESASQLMIEETNRAREKSNALLQQGLALQSAKPATPEQTLQKGVEVADKENPVAKQIEDVKVKINEMNAALAVADARFNETDAKKLIEGLEKAHEELDALQLGPVLERMHEKMADVAAKWDGLQSGMLAKQIDIAAATLASVGSNAKERVQIETQMEHLRVEMHKAAGAEVLAQIRDENTQISGETRLSGVQRLEAERDNWVKALSDDRVMGAQRLQAAHDFNTKTAEIERERSPATKAIARSDADTAIAIARLNIDAEKQALDEKLALNQISAAQKLAILQELTEREYQITLKGKNDELALLNNDVVGYARVANQILELKAKLNLDMAALDRQAAADAARQAKEQVTAWKGAVAEIESAETSMIGDLLSGRKSFAASAIQAGEALATKEIEADARAITTRLLLDKGAEGEKKAMEQGGVFYHLYAESAKTTATGGGVEARKTTEATGQAGTKVLDETGAHAHTIAEAQKSAATQTSAATRGTTEATEQGKSKVLEQTAASSHTIAEAQKTTATQTGTATRGSTDTIEQAKSKILEQTAVGSHTIAEAQKTHATQAGTATRGTTETTEQIRTRVLEQTGTNVHTASEVQKTAATHSGVGARTAAEASGSDGFFQIIGKAIAHFFGFQTAKTGATVAGEGNRTIVQTAADIEAASSGKITAASLIADYAATGAAAAGASVAAIPIYGWLAAGPTAAATYADLIGYEAALSFAGGTMKVPEDMRADIHKGEIILPSQHSEALRSLGAGSFSQIVNLARSGAQNDASSSFAAASFAAPALDVGAWNIPDVGQYTLHPEEAVVPKDFASGMRESGLAGGGQGGDSFGDTNINNHFHGVHPTTDSIMAHFAKAMRNGHPALRGIRS